MTRLPILGVALLASACATTPDLCKGADLRRTGYVTAISIQ